MAIAAESGQSRFELRVPRLPYRAIALVAAVCLAFHYSLQELLVGLDVQTPLGYLAIVPLVALLVGASTFVTQPTLRPIHDRQLDWIVGLGLIGAAATVETIVPSAFSADFWLYRLDLLGLPLFAAGLVAILYGVRRLWAVRWAVLFLLLAWPLPYETLLAGAIGTSTSITISIVEAIAGVVPLARPVGEGTFLVNHDGGAFAVSVGSACSGINSLVGFLLLGAAWNAVLHGSLLRRIAWLVAGLIVVGVLNVVRIELIFLAGAVLGAPFAFDVLHPVAGLFVFGIAALLMFGLAGRFGLRLVAAPAPRNDKPNAALPRGPRRRAWRPLVSGVACLAVAGLFAVPNEAFASYEKLVNGFGQPQLAAIDPASVNVQGWEGSNATTFDQATQYFGPHATWERVAFSSLDASVTPGVAYLDVIRTDDSAALDAYGIEACYSFHGFNESAYHVVDVGAGVAARLASYRSPDGGTNWSILWWEWPYDAGEGTRFERLVLLAPLTAPSGGQPDFPAAEASLTTVGKSIVTQAMANQVSPSSEVQP